jgi:DNA-binding MarR family transcriptional regulator
LQIIFELIFMSDTSSKKKLGQASARLFQIFDLLQQRDLTIASGKVLLDIYVRTADLARPHVPSPTEVAASLGMSVSAVSRLMQKLADQGGPKFLQNERVIPGSRAEAYVLTPMGQDFVRSMLTVMMDIPVQSLETHNLGSYAQARMEQRLTNVRLRQVSWDEPSLTLVVTPGSEFNSEEVQEWMTEFVSEKTNSKIVRKNATIKFVSLTDAVYFKLRWC